MSKHGKFNLVIWSIFIIILVILVIFGALFPIIKNQFVKCPNLNRPETDNYIIKYPIFSCPYIEIFD